MLFNSYIFVFLFLPCSLLLFYFLNRIEKYELAKATLIIMSLWFYAYFHLSYIFIILASILINFFISGLIRKKQSLSKFFLILGIVINVALIFYYKYLDFTLGNINFIFKTDIPLMKILMPLGISFFTFQQIGYLVDTYNGIIEEHNFINYALFVSFFPQLIAGPIVSYNEMVPQFKDRSRKSWDYDDFALGLFWFAVGLAKKVLIADTLGQGSDWGYANIAVINGPEALLTFLLYTFRLYFDFSGYCDMACGIAKMFRIELPVNFLSPLKSLSIMEFWNKWHITLGRFLTGYLFNPMVTSCNRKYLSNPSLEKTRKKRRKNAIGNICLFLTFFISGIWHGANWTFILWGTIQGIGRVLYQIFRKKYDKWPKPLRWCLNFIFNVFSMGLFGALSVNDFVQCLKKIFTCWKSGISYDYYSTITIPNLAEIEAHIPGIGSIFNNLSWLNPMLIIISAICIALFTKNIYEMKNRRTKFTMLATVILMFTSVLSLSRVTTFLYFNF